MNFGRLGKNFLIFGWKKIKVKVGNGETLKDIWNILPWMLKMNIFLVLPFLKFKKFSPKWYFKNHFPKSKGKNLGKIWGRISLIWKVSSGIILNFCQNIYPWNFRARNFFLVSFFWFFMLTVGWLDAWAVTTLPLCDCICACFSFNCHAKQIEIDFDPSLSCQCWVSHGPIFY